MIHCCSEEQRTYTHVKHALPRGKGTACGAPIAVAVGLKPNMYMSCITSGGLNLSGLKLCLAIVSSAKCTCFSDSPGAHLSSHRPNPSLRKAPPAPGAPVDVNAGQVKRGAKCTGCQVTAEQPTWSPHHGLWLVMLTSKRNAMNTKRMHPDYTVDAVCCHHHPPGDGATGRETKSGITQSRVSAPTHLV